MKIYKKEATSKKDKFLELYDPKVKIDIKKTAESFGVSIQSVYKWINLYKDMNGIKD